VLPAQRPISGFTLASKLADIDARIAGLTALRGELARELARPGAGCPLDAQPDTIA
jgi:MerR family copper efflux transcriptional regulator